MKPRYLVIGLAAFTACVQPPTYHPLPEPANIPESYDKTWASVIDLFAAFSIPIRTIEKASGLIMAEVLRVNPRIGQRYADCGALAVKRATYNVRVTGDSTASLVRHGGTRERLFPVYVTGRIRAGDAGRHSSESHGPIRPA